MAQRGISQEMVARTVKTGKIWVVIDKAGNVVSVGRN
jgi:hypothetical protein